MKKYLMLAAVLVLATGCSSNDQTETTQTPKTVVAQSIAKNDSVTGYDYMGIVKAKDTKNYSFLMSGKISNIYVEKGQEFKKGQVLAKLDATTLEYSSDINNNSTNQAQANLDKIKDTYDTNISNAEKNIQTLQTSIDAGEKGLKAGEEGIQAMQVALDAAQQELNAGQTALDTLKTQVDAAKEVNKAGGLSDIELQGYESQYKTKSAEYESSKAKYETSKAQLESQKATLEKSRAEVEALKTQKATAEKTLQNLKVSKEKDVSAAQSTVNSAKTSQSITQKNINDTTVTATDDGYVMELPYKEGEVISAGYPVVVAKSKSVVVTVGVSDKEYKNIKVGQKALINGSVQGTVDTIAQYPDETTRTYAVDILIPADKFTIGETVNAKIVTGSVAASYVPINAVFNMDGVDYVYVVGSDSKIHRKQVTRGDINGDNVEIKIDDPTAVVVTEGLKKLRENDLVTVEG